MRYTLFIILVALAFWGCKKDKFTTVPQISFKSLDPNPLSGSSVDASVPVLRFNLTDAEGDFDDTTYAYVKNISVPSQKSDSFLFPTLSKIGDRKNLNVDVSIIIRSVVQPYSPSTRARPYTDSLYFEVYVKDNAKNKSNVIKAGPLLYTFQ